MPDTMTPNPREHIGANLPPLADLLTEETVDLRKRAEDLAAGAGRCVVTDQDTAEKATLLARMIKGHLDALETAREARKKPFLDDGRTVDMHFKGIAGMLATFDAKGKIIGGPANDVLAKIDTFRREQERLAAEERRRLEEEAWQAREAAERAAQAQREAEERERLAREQAERERIAAEQRGAQEREEAARKVREAEAAAARAGDEAAAAEAARKRQELEAEQRRKDAEAAKEREAADRQRERDEAAARERKLQAELDEQRERERIEALERQAAATKAGPIDSGYGAKASARITRRVEITDMALARKHVLKIEPAAIDAAVTAVYERLAKAKVSNLPGAVIHEDSQTIIRG